MLLINVLSFELQRMLPHGLSQLLNFLGGSYHIFQILSSDFELSGITFKRFVIWFFSVCF